MGWTYDQTERPTRSDRKKQGGSRTQRRPQLRWEECVKRDLRKEEENWKEGRDEKNNERSRPAE